MINLYACLRQVVLASQLFLGKRRSKSLGQLMRPQFNSNYTHRTHLISHIEWKN